MTDNPFTVTFRPRPGTRPTLYLAYETDQGVQAMIENITPSAAAVAVTPHDTTRIAPTRGLYCGVSGNVKVIMLDGTTVTFTGLAAGVIHPITCVLVYSTDTTATNIVALY